MSRPLDSKLPVHLVLRSHKSAMRLLKTIKVVDRQVARTCKRHGIRLYQYANVGNHLHLLIKIPRRQRWAPFIRELTGRLAQLVRNQIGFEGDFWTQRPFTRIVLGWQRAFQIAKDYVRLNALEADHKITGPELKFLRSLRALIQSSGWDEGR
jgi:REP element-mobilizing transposase RayT